MFDGDGMVTSLSFKGGKAFFRSKYVETKEFVAERQAGKPLHRRSFSMGHPLGGLFNMWLGVQNVANTGVMLWGSRLFALYETGKPYEMRASDLATVGECNMDGSLELPRLHAHYRKVT